MSHVFHRSTDPIVAVESDGSWITDVSGRRYLDAARGRHRFDDWAWLYSGQGRHGAGRRRLRASVGVHYELPRGVFQLTGTGGADRRSAHFSDEWGSRVGGDCDQTCQVLSPSSGCADGVSGDCFLLAHP